MIQRSSQGDLPVVKESELPTKASPSIDSWDDYVGFEKISNRAYAGEITPEEKFDELLDEFEFIFSDDLVDRKRLQGALERKYNKLTAFIDQEIKNI